MEGLSPITILVGHAGVGKTNTALGIALALAERGDDVTLADSRRRKPLLSFERLP